VVEDRWNTPTGKSDAMARGVLPHGHLEGARVQRVTFDMIRRVTLLLRWGIVTIKGRDVPMEHVRAS